MVEEIAGARDAGEGMKNKGSRQTLCMIPNGDDTPQVKGRKWVVAFLGKFYLALGPCCHPDNVHGTVSGVARKGVRGPRGDSITFNLGHSVLRAVINDV
jgi:hypothetical protein